MYQKLKDSIALIRSAPLFIRIVSSSEAFLFCESSCIKSIAACPFKTGVGAIGFAIIVIIFYIFGAKIHIYSDICKEIEEKSDLIEISIQDYK